MILKKHIKDGKLIIALCDSYLSGRKFEEGTLQLDLTSNFYNGKDVPKESLRDEIRKAYIINAVGKESVELLMKLALISEEYIIKIEGVPSAQILLGTEMLTKPSV